MPVRPCAKVMYTKTQERVKIIDCSFFCLKGIRILAVGNAKSSHERMKTYEDKAELNF